MKKPLFILTMLVAMTVSACSEQQKPAAQQKSAVEGHSNMTKASEAGQAKAVSKEKLDKVEANLRTAVKDNPESAKAHVQLASFLLTQNKTLEAIPAYQDAITLDPENPKLFAALSIAYLHQSKFNMAKAMADEALRLNPEMKQVKKINEYIAAKQEVIKQAQKADAHNGVDMTAENAQKNGG